MSPVERNVFEPSPAVSRWLQINEGMAGILAIVGLAAELQFYEELAARIPDPALSARASLLKKTFPACYLAIVVLNLVYAVLEHPAQRGGAIMFVGCFAGIMAIPTFVLAIGYLLMVQRFGRVLDKQARFATDIWAVHAHNVS